MLAIIVLLLQTIKGEINMKIIRISCLLLCLLIGFSQAGCVALVAGAAVGAGTVVYIKGNLEETINASVNKTHFAALAALKEMGMPIWKDNHDQMSANMKSRFADGKHVWVDIEAITDSSCKLQIRVGTFGDEYRSRQILEAIHRNIK
jgi:hypothetical protein